MAKHSKKVEKKLARRVKAFEMTDKGARTVHHKPGSRSLKKQG